ncbi:MAG: RIP metalloprotease RseP [Candidatus Kapabacteria bacterium]|jgi:regulator of sigma E protease|nr:RIP metalloprotease RseP [Candidatus Kapabacteria bacterium]
MEILSSIFYFIIVIGILVFIHEFGHFAAARMTGMRVDVFALGMGKRLFGYNKTDGFTFGKLREDFDFDGTTDYRVAILPIGGYVKIVGMVDESFDTEHADEEPKPWEFRSKGTLAKAFAISAGVIMNFLLAILIYGGTTFFNGKEYLATTEIAYVQPESIYEDMGFVSGDEVIKIDDENVDTWFDFKSKLIVDDLGASRQITVLRDNREIVINSDGDKLLKSLANKEKLGLYPKFLNVHIKSLVADRPAEKSGLLVNDTLISIANTTIVSQKKVVEVISSNKNKDITVVIKRGIENLSFNVTPDDSGTIGILLATTYSGPKSYKSFSFFEAIADGWNETVKIGGMFFDTFSAIFGGVLTVKQSIGGPLMIAQQASHSADMGLGPFMAFMAMLSVSLALINIMPFPGLDGGHLVFIIIEGITRREIPVKVKLAFTQVGLIVLMLLMSFILYVDFTR